MTCNTAGDHSVNDLFLEKFGVASTADAMQKSIRAALQRNKTYADAAATNARKAFRTVWAELIFEATKQYSRPVADTDHCRTLGAIAQSLSDSFRHILAGGRMRFGTSQKAFNLYLKCLWRLGDLPTPPHCPIDRIVLQAAGLSGSWTQCDSEDQYMSWITAIRKRKLTNGTSLADWEYKEWNRSA
jgi:hypothetical protein